MDAIKILGYELRGGHDYAIFEQGGLRHETEHQLVMDRCKNGTHGLSRADAAVFTAAHDRYIMELELGFPLPFEGPVHKLGCSSWP